MSEISRRNFLKESSVAAAAVGVGLFGRGIVQGGVGPNDTVRVGVIGIGGRGGSHIQGFIFGRPMTAADADRLAAQNKAVAADGFQFNRPPRQGLLKVATLQWNGMQMPVRVRNISSGGALLEGDRTLPVDAKVQLDLPGCGNLGAEVRWSEAKRIGIQFEDEFDLRRLSPGKNNGFGAKLRATSTTLRSRSSASTGRM